MLFRSVIPALLGAELYAPGKVRRTGAKGASPYEVYRAGELHGRITKRIEELAEMIRTIDSVKATTNLWGERWSKLCVNGMANGVAAAADDPLTQREKQQGGQRKIDDGHAGMPPRAAIVAFAARHAGLLL